MHLEVVHIKTKAKGEIHVVEEISELDEVAEGWLGVLLEGMPKCWHADIDWSRDKKWIAGTIGIDWETYALCRSGLQSREWRNGLVVPAVRRAGARIKLDQEVVETVVRIFF